MRLRNGIFSDDGGFDEVVYLNNPGFKISEADPQIGNCFDPRAPGFKPRKVLLQGAAIPPADGFFDHDARFVGAFRDESDDWDAGNWIMWGDGASGLLLGSLQPAPTALGSEVESPSDFRFLRMFHAGTRTVQKPEAGNKIPPASPRMINWIPTKEGTLSPFRSR